MTLILSRAMLNQDFVGPVGHGPRDIAKFLDLSNTWQGPFPRLPANKPKGLECFDQKNPLMDQKSFHRVRGGGAVLSLALGRNSILFFP